MLQIKCGGKMDTSRRTFMKVGVGSISIGFAAPTLAKFFSESGSLKSLVVFHEGSAEGREFAQKFIDKGGEAFPIGDVLDPARKTQLFHRLLDSPALVVGLTNEVSAFELQMAANDAFHFKLPEDQIVVEGSGNDSLIAWAAAPVVELDTV